MTVHHIATNAELAAAITSSGDTIMLASGGVFSAAAMPADLLTKDDITLGYYGTGNKPIITGGVIRADWAYDPVNDVYSRPAYAGNTLGNVTEDGVPMRFTPWTTDLATTAALMVAGSNAPYWAGSMSYDPVAKTLYIRPSSGTAFAHEYIVSESLFGIRVESLARGLTLDGLSVRHISDHGIVVFQRRNLVISGCDFSVIGGNKIGSVWAGNGIEISFGCSGVEVTQCEFADIFDTGATSQLYETTAQTISGHHYYNNIVRRFGMHGIEVSAHTKNQRITDVEIAGLIAEDAGTFSFAGDRNGAAVTILSNQINTTRMTRVFARDVFATKMKRLYLGYGHGGVCGIEDSSATGTWGQAPRSDANGATGQVDLWRNITDNLGAPSGGQWSQVSARLRDHFFGVAL